MVKIKVLTSPTVAPFALLRKETRLSAGWDTIAQKTPAIYPPAKLTPSWKDLLHSFLGVGIACLYSISTIVSKDANFIMVSAMKQFLINIYSKPTRQNAAKNIFEVAEKSIFQF